MPLGVFVGPINYSLFSHPSSGQWREEADGDHNSIFVHMNGSLEDEAGVSALLCLRALRARIRQTSLPRGGSAAGVQVPSLEDGDAHSPCRQLPPSEVRRLWAVPAIPAPRRPFLLHPREGESARGQKRPGTLHNSLHMEKT